MLKYVISLARSAAIIELVRFGLVGCVGLATDIAILKLYLYAFGDRPYSGQPVAFAFAVTVTWWLNRHFTFRNRERTPMLRQWAHFVVVNSTGAIANYATYVLLLSWVPLCRSMPTIAVAAGAVAGMFFNFTGARRLVFKI